MLLEIGLLKRKKQTNKHKTKNKNKKQNNGEINRSNRSFNMPPPRQLPGHLTFLKIIVQIPPYPGQNAVQMTHTGVHSADQMPPTPGTFHRHQNDRRKAETPSVVEQNLYEYNKNWETLLAYLLRRKVSCKAAEIATTRSLNAQLFFVMQHTKRSIKKIPPIEITTSWPFYWHASRVLYFIVNTTIKYIPTFKAWIQYQKF